MMRTMMMMKDEIMCQAKRNVWNVTEKQTNEETQPNSKILLTAQQTLIDAGNEWKKIKGNRGRPGNAYLENFAETTKMFHR